MPGRLASFRAQFTAIEAALLPPELLAGWAPPLLVEEPLELDPPDELPPLEEPLEELPLLDEDPPELDPPELPLSLCWLRSVLT